MLRYKVERTPEQLKVSIGSVRWRDLFIYLVLFLLSVEGVFKLVRQLSMATATRVALDIPLLMGIAFVACLAFVLARLVVDALETHRFIFDAEGVCDESFLFGLRRDMKWYEQEEVYSFGYGHLAHGDTSILKFWLPYYQQVVLAYGVTEEEAEGFVAMLAGEGFSYPEQLGKDELDTAGHATRLYTEV